MSGESLTLARPLPGHTLPPRSTAANSARPIPRPGPVANATLIGRNDLTEAIAIFRVRPDDGPRPFAPGQYFSLGLIVEGALLQRPYSNASAAGSEELEFLIRRVPVGAFTPILWETRVGARVFLGRAKGLFTLQADDSRAHLFIATGTGLAPFVAMLAAIHERPDPPPAVVVHGVAHVAELAYRDHLGGLHVDGRLRYVPTVSRPSEARNAGWDGAQGRATQVLPSLFETHLDARTTVAYLCGNPAMVDDAREVLLGVGLPAAAIVLERYWAD